MAIGLKNAYELILDTFDLYDFGVNEECIERDECNYYEPFFKQQKAVFGVEYGGGKYEACQKSQQTNIIMTKYSSNKQYYNCFDHPVKLAKTEHYEYEKMMEVSPLVQ
eukprot:Pgem_evm1s8878